MNKTALLLLITGTLLLTIPVSCKDAPNPAAKYGEEVVDKYKSAQEFGGAINVQRLQQAVTTFRVSYGRFPENLQELEKFAGVQLDPNTYDYDPSSGKITFHQ